MANEQRIKLRYFFLKELPKYIAKRINEVVDREALEEHLEESRKRYDMIIEDRGTGFCRSISQIVSLGLKIHGFNADMRDVQLLLVNKYAQKIFDEKGMNGLVDAKKQKEKKSHTIGCGFTDYWDDFHTVVVIDDTVLDMTASGLKRTKKGIIINNYWCTLEELRKKYKCILIYNIFTREVNSSSTILDHPKLLDIINFVSEQISVKLNLPKKSIEKLIFQ